MRFTSLSRSASHHRNHRVGQGDGEQPLLILGRELGNFRVTFAVPAEFHARSAKSGCDTVRVPTAEAASGMVVQIPPNPHTFCRKRLPVTLPDAVIVGRLAASASRH